MRMRQVLALFSVAALAMGAADAALGSVPILLRTPGAELVELQAGRGRAAVARRGSLLVHITSGELRIVDLAGGGRPSLSSTCRRRTHRVGPRTVEIRGRNIGCLIASGENGGPWQAIIKGRGIFASGRVSGSLTLDGPSTGPAGGYRIAGRSWQRWPRSAHTYVLHSK